MQNYSTQTQPVLHINQPDAAPMQHIEADPVAAALEVCQAQLATCTTTLRNTQEMLNRLRRAVYESNSMWTPVTDALTHRETEVLRLVAQELSNQEIADRLVLSIKTVKGHMRHILHKLDARSRWEAVDKARQQCVI